MRNAIAFGSDPYRRSHLNKGFMLIGIEPFLTWSSAWSSLQSTHNVQMDGGSFKTAADQTKLMKIVH
ncbi:MAG TPA: hypothetical protein DCE52_01925 [Rhodobacteraceae bacterium]|nr:hypothetical protein [Paracoccaceae bacterium]